jgi:hypothetical protein
MPKHIPKLPKATMEDLQQLDAQIAVLTQRKNDIVGAVLRAMNVKLPKGQWQVQPDGSIVPVPKPRLVGAIAEKRNRAD